MNHPLNSRLAWPDLAEPRNLRLTLEIDNSEIPLKNYWLWLRGELPLDWKRPSGMVRSFHWTNCTSDHISIEFAVVGYQLAVSLQQPCVRENAAGDASPAARLTLAAEICALVASVVARIQHSQWISSADMATPSPEVFEASAAAAHRDVAYFRLQHLLYDVDSIHYATHDGLRAVLALAREIGGAWGARFALFCKAEYFFSLGELGYPVTVALLQSLPRNSPADVQNSNYLLIPDIKSGNFVEIRLEALRIVLKQINPEKQSDKLSSLSAHINTLARELPEDKWLGLSGTADFPCG